jgi:hypothetical protein
MASSPLREKLHRRLRSLDVPPPLAADLEREAADCLALVPTADPTLSRFGGPPLASAGLVWPSVTLEGELRYPRFLGQLDFAEMGLPHAGLLYLFVEYLGSAAEPVRLHGVVHPGGPLAELEPPDAERLCDVEELEELQPCHVAAVPSLSLPLGVRAFVHRIDDAGDDLGVALEELEWTLFPEHRVGQLLGWARSHDGAQDLYRKAHFASLGQIQRIYIDHRDSADELEVERGAADWRMLLRLDSNPSMALQINDADPLFVFARAQSLATSRFDGLLGLVLQG